MLVGDVLVKSEGDQVCVKFVLNVDAIAAGWLITEAHVAVGNAERTARAIHHSRFPESRAKYYWISSARTGKSFRNDNRGGRDIRL